MRVSVIIPLYYGMKYIKRLITMLQHNYDNLSDGHDMEVIFVKDSLEKFDESIFNTSETDMSIKLLLNDRNYGIQYSRIKGIENSSGEYIHMLDQDDEISNNFIENALNKIGKADVLVCNGKKQYDGYYKILYKYRFMQWTVKHKWFYTKFSCRILSPGQCLIKKKSIPSLWMNNILKNSGTDDAFLWLLMLSDRCKFKLEYNIMYIHNITSVNLSSDSEKMGQSLKELIGICKKTKCLDNNTIKRMELSLNREKKSKLVQVIEKINKEK